MHDGSGVVRLCTFVSVGGPCSDPWRCRRKKSHSFLRCEAHLFPATFFIVNAGSWRFRLVSRIFRHYRSSSVREDLQTGGGMKQNEGMCRDPAPGHSCLLWTPEQKKSLKKLLKFWISIGLRTQQTMGRPHDHFCSWIMSRSPLCVTKRKIVHAWRMMFSLQNMLNLDLGTMVQKGCSNTFCVFFCLGICCLNLLTSGTKLQLPARLVRQNLALLIFCNLSNVDVAWNTPQSGGIETRFGQRSNTETRMSRVSIVSSTERILLSIVECAGPRIVLS